MNRLVLALLASCFAQLGAAPAAAPADAPGKVIYSNDFENAEEGKVPEGLMVLDGEFAVVKENGNKVLELAAAPLKSWGVLVGAEGDAVTEVRARIRAEAAGRRTPEFGIGMGGVGGLRLWIMPAVNEVQLVKSEERQVAVSAPFTWKSGSWTMLRLRMITAGEGRWVYEGKAWEQGRAEPEQWTLRFEDTEEPPNGRPSLWGIPYSEKPIAFDDVAAYGVPRK